MTAIKCKECGGTVSSHAKTCPHCGAGRKKFKSRTLSIKNMILFPVVAFFAISILGVLNNFGSWLTGDNASEQTVDASGSLDVKSSKTPNSDLVCKAAVSFVFDQPFGSVTIVKSGSVSEIAYTRAVDDKYRCKLKGDEVIFAELIDGKWERWRDNYLVSAKTTYRMSEGKLFVYTQPLVGKLATQEFDFQMVYSKPNKPDQTNQPNEPNEPQVAKVETPSVGSNFICRAGISTIFGRPVSSISAVKNGPMIELSYIRAADGSKFKYRCRLSDNEIIWAGLIDGKWGRWRDHAADAKVTYWVTDDKLMVSEKYPSSSEASVEAFDLNSL